VSLVLSTVLSQLAPPAPLQGCRWWPLRPVRRSRAKYASLPGNCPWFQSCASRVFAQSGLGQLVCENIAPLRNDQTRPKPDHYQTSFPGTTDEQMSDDRNLAIFG